MEDKTIFDRKRIPKKERDYLRKIGEELLQYRAFEFYYNPEDVTVWELPEINISYLWQSHYKKNNGGDLIKQINICPHAREGLFNKIEEIYCDNFDEQIRHLVANDSGLGFFYKHAHDFRLLQK